MRSPRSQLGLRGRHGTGPTASGRHPRRSIDGSGVHGIPCRPFFKDADTLDDEP